MAAERKISGGSKYPANPFDIPEYLKEHGDDLNAVTRNFIARIEQYPQPSMSEFYLLVFSAFLAKEKQKAPSSPFCMDDAIDFITKINQIEKLPATLKQSAEQVLSKYKESKTVEMPKFEVEQLDDVLPAIHCVDSYMNFLSCVPIEAIDNPDLKGWRSEESYEQYSKRITEAQKKQQEDKKKQQEANEKMKDEETKEFMVRLERLQQPKSKEKIAYFAVSRALRNSPENDARKMATTLLQMRETPEDIKRGAQQALKHFERWGCQIARYRQQDRLEWLSSNYTNGEHISIEDEINYGEECFKDAEQALKLSMDPTARPFQNGPLAFLDDKQRVEDKQKLNEIKKYGMRVAIEFLMNRHCEQATRRGGRAGYSMKTGRASWKQIYTPLYGYQWAIPIVAEVMELSKNKSEAIKDLKHRQVECKGEVCEQYFLTYQDLELTRVILNSNDLLQFNNHSWLDDEYSMYHPFKSQWVHGFVPLTVLWPRLEELHDEVMNFPLDKSNPGSLRQFYDKVVETIWLLGNLTPAERGTGKLAEQYFTMAHLKHGLRTPILKLEYPQLDVLDITFPLSIYKKRFFEFFELESLPRPIADRIASQRSQPAEKSATVTIVQAGGSPIHRIGERENKDLSVADKKDNRLG